ncbi:hypothetical protein KBB68_03080 [Candidatus Babeliales bacterium]|nr:hypothetical protein [Candidatus Babeliales bacterium]
MDWYINMKRTIQTFFIVCTHAWISTSPAASTFGGTGNSSLTAYALITGGTTSTAPLQQISGTGSSGQVLTSNGAGALPSWQADGNTGTTNGFVFLKTVTASNSAYLSFNSADLSSTYKVFCIVIHGIAPSIASVSLQALWSTNNGSTYLNTGYSAGVNYLSYNTTAVTNVNSSTFIPLGSTTNLYYSGVLYFYGANGALSSGPALSGITASGYTPVYGNVIATISGNPNVNNIKFQFSSENISSGSISLYGLV